MKSKSKSAGAQHPLVGKKAPAFNLEDAAGTRVALKDLTAERDLVLYFYPKDMTTGCTREACDFRDNLATLKKAGALVVGVSGDSSESHRKFADKYDLTFQLLSDPDRRAANAYGVFKEKSLYGRKFMGIERTTFLIDRKGIVRRVFPKVRVENHARAVLDALREMRDSAGS